MSENQYASRDLYVRGVAAVKGGDHQEGRFFLEWYLSQNPPARERNDALFYLYQIEESSQGKRKLLESILEKDPLDIRARRAMAILNGELKKEDVVNPDHLPKQQPQVIQGQTADRFRCPQCGGKMSFSPDGQTLICENCEMTARKANKGQVVKDENFILALATAKGHSQAVNTQVICCRGCSAEFVVPPKQLSWQCPFCESDFAIHLLEERQIIEPNSLIPFYVPKKEAQLVLQDWLEQAEADLRPYLRTLQGIYLPVWTFDVGGVISWQWEVRQNKKWKVERDQKTLFLDDICVPATRYWSEWMDTLIAGYDLKQLVPFDAAYLANWMAETYEIQAGDAALQAREIALKKEKHLIRSYSMQTVRSEAYNSTQMTVEQYKLILIPVWSGVLQVGQQQIQALINGQNGSLITPEANDKRPGILGWVERLLDSE